MHQQLKERQRVQLEQGLIEEGDARSDGDFRRTVVESERLEKEYAHYFDSRIVNADFGETFSTLVRFLINFIITILFFKP